ncbi:hypothetical protein O3M35_012863 [Rhynocoris fuscipes]|uniref:Ribosomal protein eL8/eL30/eS12/Gadd45 domain-containing protein n=1 Tax=Rhynocoris fuscipes TaxID=488301 RepID=A0AAW1CG90_9HEMI
MFKKVLLGEDKDVDIFEQSEWPELGSGSGNGKWRSNTNINVNDRNLDNKRRNDSNKVLSKGNCSAASQSNDFPNLMESIDMQNNKRNRITNSEQYNASSKLKKPKKLKKTPSKAPLTLDLNVMLNLSIALSQQKQLKKRKLSSKLRSLPLQEQLSLKTGNKLDSDCPVRYKGKKRPHRKRKISRIKCSFQRAAQKPLQSDNNSLEYKVSLNRLRQSILHGLDKREPVDDLVHNLGRITLNDIKSGENNEFSAMDFNKTAQSLLHTKNFKPYCSHLPKSELKEKSKELIKTLRVFQDRMYAKDPIKSKSKRRYVCGCREVRKFLKAESVKLLFFANNLSVDNEMPEILEEILGMCDELNVPVIFSGSAYDLGMWTLKKRKTSVIAILNYEGADKLCKEIIEDLNKAKEDYQQLLQKVSFCLQRKFNGQQTDMECLLQEVEEQIRDNIISKLS